MGSTLVSASILAADFANLEKEIKSVQGAGADMLHLDIMDGRFVSNITFGCDVIKSIRKHAAIPFDVHLMIDTPEKYIETFATAGSDIITVHAEATQHIDRVINQIHSCGKKAGLALNPATHENILEYVIDKLDYILVMTVNPGFAGQTFIASQLPKIERIKQMISSQKREIMLAADGGLNKDNAQKCQRAGANVIVAAKAIFASSDYAQAITELRGST